MTREEAIEVLQQDIPCEHDTDLIEALEMAIQALEQEPKTGHWSHDGSHWKNRFICSECGYKLFDEPTNYCPNCGCRMVEQESEETETWNGIHGQITAPKGTFEKIFTDTEKEDDGI